MNIKEFENVKIGWEVLEEYSKMNLKRLLLLGQLREAIENVDNITRINRCRKLIDSIVELEDATPVLSKTDDNESIPVVRTTIFATSTEAEKVISHLAGVLRTYGEVKIADYYDAVGITPTSNDYNYGWKSLSDACVLTVEDGYIVVIPNQVHL